MKNLFTRIILFLLPFNFLFAQIVPNIYLEFNGGTTYVNCGNAPSLNITGTAITLEAWINMDSWKAREYGGCIINKEDPYTGYTLRCGLNGTLNFNCGDSIVPWNELNSEEGALKLNTWHHVAGTYDGSFQRIYIDGVEVGNVERHIIIGGTSVYNLFIGNWDRMKDRCSDGKIDEVRIWNVARTQAQIQATMNDTLSSAYYSTPDSGLVGYWRLDEGAGQTITDLSFYGNHGVLGKTSDEDDKDPVWRGPHDGSKALIFDGIDDFVNCDDNGSIKVTGSEITLQAWIYPEQWRPFFYAGCIINKEESWSGKHNGYTLRCGEGGKLDFAFADGTNWYEITTAAGVLKLDAWQYVTATYDGDSLRLFVDSKQVLSGPANATIGDATGVNLYIGSFQKLNDRSFNGKIDEVKIWNVARNRDQILDDMCTFKSDPAEPGLAGYWHFNEGVGQITADTTANNNDGILGSTEGVDANDPKWAIDDVKFNIVIDGEMDEFYKTLSNPENGHFQITHLTYCNGQAPFGPRDIYSKVWVAWDSTYFYLYEEVLDQYLVLDNLDPRANDCLELHFDVIPWSSDITVSNVRLSVLDSIDVAPEYWSGVSNMEPQEGFGGPATYHDYTRKVTSTGYVLELRIAWDSLYTPNKSINANNYSIIGFAMNNNDNDWNGLDCSTMWSAIVDDGVCQNREMLGYIQLLPDNKIKLSAVNFLTGTVNPDSNTYNPNFVVGIKSESGAEKPVEFKLSQNYPNPFNPTTTIEYSIPTSVEKPYPAKSGQVMASLQHVTLKVYDLLGREVKTLVNEYQESNNYNVNFNAGDLASGLYFYRLTVDGKIISVKKMMLLR
ncbi:MAG: LamG-like jellyroll fold domain-containing protein [bacterium]